MSATTQAQADDRPSARNPKATFGDVTSKHVPPLLTGTLRELLDAKFVVMTGVTGFIGEQILWKVLTELPTTKVGVLVRPKGSVSARERTIALVRKSVFKPVREAAGGAEQLVDQRIVVIEGDLPNVPDLPEGIDVLIHCAGDVSFDPPIDAAFKTNVIGTKALLDKLIASCSDADGNLVRVPHYLHVSTAYTAGRRRGAIPEAAHTHEVDYRVETEAALAMGAHVEAQSRTSEQLTILRKQAEREHRQAGYLTTAVDTEARRQAWIKEQLIAAGTERARSLGWTDVYTFAKAMGERVVCDVGQNIRVSIVRPAIVESSLKHPYPGWIEGFKMADPIILAYGRGQLPQLPASPDAVLDIVPCDHVVNAIVAVAATQPEIGVPEFYHSASGARNPLTIRGIYENVREYFTNHPLVTGPDAKPPATWTFPGPDSVERYLAWSERAHKLADRAISFAPRSQMTRDAVTKLDTTGKQLGFLRRYLSLYGEYLQSELHFVDDATLALNNSLDPSDVEAFAFDTAVIDWHHYMQEVHIPAIMSPIKRMDALRKRRGARASTYKDLKSAEPGTVLAAFDLDGTVLRTNVIETYLRARLPELSAPQKVMEVAGVLGRLPSYLSADRRDRSAFLRSIYRRYAGVDLAALQQTIDTTMSDFIRDRISPEAIARIKAHRDAGHTTILLTGVISQLTSPIADLFDVIVAAELGSDANGKATGFLEGPPMVGESRAAWLRHYADLHQIDLSKSYAYADSHVDLPMLTEVGNPVAVGPDVGLTRAARQRGWSIIDWPASSKPRRGAGN